MLNAEKNKGKLTSSLMRMFGKLFLFHIQYLYKQFITNII